MCRRFDPGPDHCKKARESRICGLLSFPEEAGQISSGSFGLSRIEVFGGADEAEDGGFGSSPFRRKAAFAGLEELQQGCGRFSSKIRSQSFKNLRPAQSAAIDEAVSVLQLLDSARLHAASSQADLVES